MKDSLPKRACALVLMLGLVAMPIGARPSEVRLSAPGAGEDLANRLRDGSLTLETAKRDDATPQDILAAARADYARLIGVMFEAGRYGPSVRITVDGREAAAIPPLEAPARIDEVQITVDPGPAFLFDRAEVTPRAPGTELPKGFRRGALARADTIRDAAQAGVEGWRDTGHAKARVADQSITADHGKQALTARIALAPGPRLRFGSLIPRGESRVRPDRIREIAGLPEGTTFDPEEVDRAATRLRRTGTFQSVAMQEAETANPDGTLDINAQIVDAKRRRIGFGAELSSLEGVMLSGFWLHRNLLGGAERLRIDAEVGGIGGDSGGMDYLLKGRFERPATITPDTALYIEGELAEEDEPDYRERRVRLGAGASHIFSDTLTGEAGIAYQYTEIDDDLGSRTIEHLLFPTSLTWDTRDNTLDARKGFYVAVEATPFLGLDQGGSGARLYTDARGYLALDANDSVIAAARAQIGSVNGAGLTEVPPNMLFFSGGAGTVRGQPYQSLAVDLGGGNRLGGRSFFALSGEIRADLKGKFGAVAFADTGFVGQDSWGSRNGDWHSGAGFGLRYDTGIGPIRVDLATPLDNGAGEDFELYIGIGQAF
ncbi:autotransporter assembly complex family protein [Roseovarius sp. MMSF_3281]|uniref:autotransporter assembly complex protein TamA n=1 Tax=Roseovarius sp. MMSF_3281 TaxID=3046694 RepID=UPI00273D6603|nr:autotransporter assembly complex family protein [Roseovarius sp. MMSF_3281]